MHTNFRNIHKISPIVLQLEKTIKEQYVQQDVIKHDDNKPMLEKKDIVELIENQCVLVGKYVPISELKIKKRLHNFIKQNRVALRYERSCRWQIKNFSASTFLLCEVCGCEQNHFSWIYCTKCGAFNFYQF